MKKIFYLVIIIGFLFTLSTQAVSKIEISQFPSINYNLESSSDSHTVIVEFGATSTSIDSAIASSQLYEIFSEQNLDFYFITYVSDENEETFTRMQELGISDFPSVSFDGGYIKIVGEQTNSKFYSDAIFESLSREVAPIELFIDAYWTSSPCYPLVNTNIEIYNNLNEEYHGRLIVSIVEIDSRWKDSSERPFNYAFVDKAADKHFVLDSLPFGSYVNTFTWFPNIDVCGAPADPNVLVIASVFSEETGLADATVVSRLVAGDQPQKPVKPFGPTKVESGVVYSYTTKSTDPEGEKIRYGWDWNGDYIIDEYTDYFDSGEEVTINHVFEEKRKLNIQVKAIDESRLQSFWSDPLSITFSKNKGFSYDILREYPKLHLFFEKINLLRR